MRDWDSTFKTAGRYFLTPQEDMKRIVAMLKKKCVNTILDLGCGSGRHTIILAKAKFKVYGMDISEAGLKLTKEWLKESRQKAKLVKASCYKRSRIKIIILMLLSLYR